MDSLTYGIIGCGRISSNHLKAAYKSGLRISCLCDINEQRLEEKYDKISLYTPVRKYTDYKLLLQETPPDIIAICTDNGSHGRIALDCIEAGSNVIIEKPIALNLEEADKIIDTSKNKGVKVAVCHQNRFNKAIMKVREAVEENRLGRLLYGSAHILWSRSRMYYDQASWRGTWESDGGALMNQCIHNIDMLRWMMGDDIKEVTGLIDNINHPYIEAEDLGLAIIKFQNGAYGLIEGTVNVFPDNLEETLYILGEKGTIKVGGKALNLLEEWSFQDIRIEDLTAELKYRENPPNIYGFGHLPLYEDMIASIKNNRSPYVDALAGRNALELILAIYKSSQEKKTIALPLKTGSTLDFKGDL